MYVTYWRVNLGRMHDDYLVIAGDIPLGLYRQADATLFKSKRRAKQAFREWNTGKRRIHGKMRLEGVNVQVKRGLFGKPIIKHALIKRGNW